MLINSLKKLKLFGFEPINILDIGANKGKWSLLVKKKVFPLANYTLIEAIDYDELSSINNFSNMTSMIVLLDEKVGKVIWNEMRNTGDSIYKENTSYFDDCKKIERDTTTLDIIFQDKKSFDLIKIDCQGAEIPILKGGKNTISNTSVIILEMPFMGEYNIGVPNFYEHIKYMDEIGYQVYDIIEMHRAEDILIQIDIIFLKKGHIFEKKVNNIIKNLGK
jgi:FkbM family methyltransferase